jgi:hypothetical protein
MTAPRTDRFGIGYRPELAASILAHLDRIDVVEVLADRLFRAPGRELRAYRTLGAQVPLSLHGVSLGLASAASCDARPLRALARVIDALAPEHWSEHLAFVRAGGREIGHLAAPPRTPATLEGLLKNLERARSETGAAPLLENVASLIDPPGSCWDETEWLAAVLRDSSCGLLLDLHNLHANAVNFGFDPLALLDRLPAGSVRMVHLAGGTPVRARSGVTRVLDDHLHDVPDPVYDLLVAVGARVPQPLTVIIERDGAYPPFAQLLAQLERARTALAAGRALARVGETPGRAPASPSAEAGTAATRAT